MSVNQIVCLTDSVNKQISVTIKVRNTRLGRNVSDCSHFRAALSVIDDAGVCKSETAIGGRKIFLDRISLSKGCEVSYSRVSWTVAFVAYFYLQTLSFVWPSGLQHHSPNANTDPSANRGPNRSSVFVLYAQLPPLTFMASTSKVEKQPNWAAAAKQAAKKLSRKLQKLTAAEKRKIHRHSCWVVAVFVGSVGEGPLVAVLAARLRLLKEN